MLPRFETWWISSQANFLKANHGTIYRVKNHGFQCFNCLKLGKKFSIWLNGPKFSTNPWGEKKSNCTEPGFWEKELGLPNPIHKDNVLFSWNRQVLIAIMTWFIPATWTTLKQILTLPLSLHVTMWAMKKGPLVGWGIQGIILSYMGIIINHYKDPYLTTSIMESRSRRVFFVAHVSFQPSSVSLGRILNVSDMPMLDFFFPLMGGWWWRGGSRRFL